MTLDFTKRWSLIYGVFLMVMIFMEISAGIDVLPEKPDYADYTEDGILSYLSDIAIYFLKLLFFTTPYTILNIFFDILHFIVIVEVIEYIAERFDNVIPLT